MVQYPIFVYGTLKQGFRNHDHCLDGNYDKKIDATITGQLFNVGYFPALIEKDGIVKGELYYLPENRYEEILNRLDRLEGFNPVSNNGMYLRKLRAAETSEGTTECYVYIWNNSVRDLVKIEGNPAEYKQRPL